MKPTILHSLAAVAALAVSLFAGAQTAPAKKAAAPQKKAAREFATLQLEEQIPVPNVAGRLDHFTADAKRKRLIVSALGNNTVEIIDVFAGRVIHSISGVAEPQGPLYVPEFDKLFVADAGDGKLNIFDGGSYTLRKSIDLGADPDNVRYDAASKKVFVGFGEDDGGIAMIDPATEERVGEVFKTGGHPESFQIEASGGHIFANVPDQGNVVESIDRKTGAVTKWPLKGLKGNYAMALNEEDHSGPGHPDWERGYATARRRRVRRCVFRRESQAHLRDRSRRLHQRDRAEGPEPLRTARECAIHHRSTHGLFF
ncbi:MAG: hypothetical protein DMG68_12810 [Acidobacteria bacterium]|nr:MAG: hypothetical protein DMG68_12810 [Acidobacteriota bacterium]